MCIMVDMVNFYCWVIYNAHNKTMLLDHLTIYFSYDVIVFVNMPYIWLDDRIVIY